MIPDEEVRVIALPREYEYWLTPKGAAYAAGLPGDIGPDDDPDDDSHADDGDLGPGTGYEPTVPTRRDAREASMRNARAAYLAMAQQRAIAAEARQLAHDRRSDQMNGAPLHLV